MRILFVSSGNKSFNISPIVLSQGESLKKFGINVDYFLIKKKGILGYLSHLKLLRNYISKTNPDIVHSHYLLSALLTTLCNPKYHAVSLMGSDVYHFFWRKIIKIFAKKLWNVTIVKSERMKDLLQLNNLYIIPNGVDLLTFYPIDKKIAREKLKINTSENIILFGADPSRKEKNYNLAFEALKLLENNNIKVLFLKDISHENVLYYLNSADVLLLTSKYEGSPNVIKEAMACNCPIVSTDVGDVKWVIGNTEGCYITSFETDDVAHKIKLALEFSEKYGKTNGRQRIIELGLDSDTIAKKIIDVYKEVLNN